MLLFHVKIISVASSVMVLGRLKEAEGKGEEDDQFSADVDLHL